MIQVVAHCAPKALGRTALVACILGLLLGAHIIVWILVSLDIWYLLELGWCSSGRMFLLWQWCSYAIALCCFHLLEFAITALYNPTECSSDSFLVNHSTAYTAAALTSWLEFGIRFCFFPSAAIPMVSYAGLPVLWVAQFIRSSAMATAGESFNHLIQTSKKDNHRLITHGIYRWFRHPSYVGFFYWSIATQMVLGNPVHTILFAMASWSFFRRRIPYEEETLRQHFPDYPAYAARTWMGIPFIRQS